MADKYSLKLPESIIHIGRRWGLRLKKENGKWYTRYVTRTINLKTMRKGGYDSICCGGARSITGSMKKMIRKLETIEYEAE